MQLTSLKFFYLARYSGLSISQGLDCEYPVLLCRSGLLDYLRLRCVCVDQHDMVCGPCIRLSLIFSQVGYGV